MNAEGRIAELSPQGRSPDVKWQAPEAGRHYETGRWRSRRAALRDVRLVEALLRRHYSGAAPKRCLDAPCGTGRLFGLLASTGAAVVGLDISRSMLGAAQGREGAALVAGSVFRLPFPDDSFEVVVCCRLLHHLARPEDVSAVLSELVRVSSRLVIASFWDGASLQGLRRKLGLHRPRGPGRRVPSSRTLMRRLVREAGAEIAGFRASLRFVSLQTFFAAVKHRGGER